MKIKDPQQKRLVEGAVEIVLESHHYHRTCIVNKKRIQQQWQPRRRRTSAKITTPSSRRFSSVARMLALGEGISEDGGQNPSSNSQKVPQKCQILTEAKKKEILDGKGERTEKTKWKGEGR
ncbi:hypothetical protein V6N13_037631 [Hibiscus sabdariffa]